MDSSPAFDFKRSELWMQAAVRAIGRGCHGVAWYLQRRFNGDGIAWPAVGTIAAALSASPRSVARSLASLEAAGLIATTRRGKCRTAVRHARLPALGVAADRNETVCVNVGCTAINGSSGPATGGSPSGTYQGELPSGIGHPCPQESFHASMRVMARPPSKQGGSRTGGRADEWVDSCSELNEHSSQGEQIRPPIRALCPGLSLSELRRHVQGRTHCFALCHSAESPHERGEPRIDQDEPST